MKIDPFKALLELYRRKDIEGFPFFQKQLTALKYLIDQTTIEVLYGVVLGGGKSWLGCSWQILNRISMPESAGLIAREELTKLTDTTQKTFFKACKFFKLKLGEDYKFNAQKNIITFQNGSEIFFREIKYIPSDQEFDRLGSYDLTDIFWTKLSRLHWKARNVLRAAHLY